MGTVDLRSSYGDWLHGLSPVRWTLNDWFQLDTRFQIVLDDSYYTISEKTMGYKHEEEYKAGEEESRAI